MKIQKFTESNNISKKSFEMNDEELINRAEEEFRVFERLSSRIGKELLKRFKILTEEKTCPECTAVAKYDSVLGIWKCNECEWEGQL